MNSTSTVHSDDENNRLLLREDDDDDEDDDKEKMRMMQCVIPLANVFTWTTDKLPRSMKEKKESGIPFGVFVSPFGEMSSFTKSSYKKKNDDEEQNDSNNNNNNNSNKTTTTEKKEEERKKEASKRGDDSNNNSNNNTIHIDANLISRCGTCFGYANAYCEFELNGFNCSLCGALTQWRNEEERERYKRVSRYANSKCDVRARKHFDNLPELRENYQEYLVARERVCAKTSTSGPAYVVLIDVSADATLEALEIAKSSAMAALEAVSCENEGNTDATFAIVTFDGGLTMFDVVGRQKVYVENIDELSREELLMNFESLVKIRRVFARVDKYKEQILAAIDSISRNCCLENETDEDNLRKKMAQLNTTGDGKDSDLENGRGKQRRLQQRHLYPKRAFGPALALVLDFLGAFKDEITDMESNINDNSSSKLGIDVFNLNDANEGDVAITSVIEEKNGDDNDNALSSLEFDGARVLCFLSGMPNAGDGKIYTTSSEKNALLNDYLSEMDSDLRAKATDELFMSSSSSSSAQKFYESCGRRASVNNVCIDTILCSGPSLFCGLHAISILSSISGGIVLRNNTNTNSIENENVLASEVFKLLQNVNTRTARDCAIRLRTSSEFLVANSYGDSLRDDKKYKGLYHVARMEKSDSFAFDFDFTNRNGFGDEIFFEGGEEECSPPILQMAFEYTITEYNSTTNNKYYERRRIRRVCTSAKKVARNLREVRDFANEDAVFALVSRKVFNVLKSDGLKESRYLVIDWLCALIAKLAKISGDTYVDVRFEKKHNAKFENVLKLVYYFLVSETSPLCWMHFHGLLNENQPDKRALLLHHCKRLSTLDLIGFIIIINNSQDDDKNVEEAMKDEYTKYFGFSGFSTFIETNSV